MVNVYAVVSSKTDAESKTIIAIVGLNPTVLGGEDELLGDEDVDCEGGG